MSEENGDQRSGLRLAVEIFVVVLIILVLVGIGTPAIIVSPRKSDRAEAVSNAKQLALALFTFREDYGSYPCEESAIEVRNNTGSTATLGKVSSNDFFRQLIASGMMDQERPVFARTLSSRKPDNVVTGTRMLEKGEVGFAYVVSHAACKEKDFPLVITPLAKGKLQFDDRSAKKFFHGRVIVLRTDNSVVVHSLNEDGRVILNGKDFFDPTQPFWHGIPPKVAWPE